MGYIFVRTLLLGNPCLNMSIGLLCKASFFLGTLAQEFALFGLHW